MQYALMEMFYLSSTSTGWSHGYSPSRDLLWPGKECHDTLYTHAPSEAHREGHSRLHISTDRGKDISSTLAN